MLDLREGGARALDPATKRAALLIGLIGLALRAWAVGEARFTGDESFFWATARNTALLEATPIYGPSLTGSGAYHPGPLFYYLLALPQRLGASPWFGGVFVVLLHGYAAYLLFDLTARARSARAALIALCLWCFAPWDVLYGDRIWLSCVAPVWGAIVLYGASRLDARRWQLALVFFVLTCPQLHMSAPIVWLAAAVIVALGPRPRWSRAALIGGALLALCAYLPPLYWELTHDFSNTRAILSEGGGKEPWEKVIFTPLKVALYAIFYASSEIGYQFGTGYWLPFDDVAAYFTAGGWRARLDRLGLLHVALNACSALFALGLWCAALARLPGRVLEAWRKRSGLVFGLDEVLALAMFAALMAAMVLLGLSRKGYFPHYTNLLMPMVLVPLAAALDRLWPERGRIARLIPIALGVSMAAMFWSTVRYYREVDRLNGLDATLSMVERVMDGPMPIDLTFDGFQNRFAWEMLANVRYRRPLELRPNAPLRWSVKNAAIASEAAALQAGATLHDGVLLLRSPAAEAR